MAGMEEAEDEDEDESRLELCERYFVEAKSEESDESEENGLAKDPDFTSCGTRWLDSCRSCVRRPVMEERPPIAGLEVPEPIRPTPLEETETVVSIRNENKALKRENEKMREESQVKRILKLPEAELKGLCQSHITPSKQASIISSVSVLKLIPNTVDIPETFQFPMILTTDQMLQFEIDDCIFFKSVAIVYQETDRFLDWADSLSCI
ncbi:hypothetical protein EMCRGX_G015292 [Ephydatia muelleri]